MNRILSFFLSRGLWNFLGLVALALLIWVAGPLLAIGASRPLESAAVRAWVIGLIFLVWILRWLWRKWREGRLNARLLGQLRRQSRSQPARSDKNEQDDDLRELSHRFGEALDLLKKARFSDARRPAWMQRFSRQYIYQLPWYVFIGAPGSGKTTALVNSGLNFPLSERFGKTAVRGVGGTRNCDWWFTDEAVLLDTAGRYTTHESDQVGDEKEWLGFLGLLSRYRGRQPINGAILTVSVADLLSATDAERVQHAATLRRRLNELREQLGIQFPIYVLVTKTDLLSGFEAYFSSFSREELAQVWGFTFPFDKAQQPGFNLYESFQEEFGLLEERLNAALPHVVSVEPDADRRALAYMLPQQFATLRAMLGQFLSDVFSTSRYEARLLPRGVYFTSGTQEGEPFDQVTGQLKRYLRIDGVTDGDAGRSEGRSYFLKNLLQQLIFREAGLAGRNHRWERRYRQLHWLGYGLLASAAVVLLTGWIGSYRNNKAYLEEIAERVPVVEKASRDVKVSDSGEVHGLLSYLNTLWYLPHSQHFSLEDPSMRYGFGLYQGDKMRAASDGVYQHTLETVMLPQAARRVEQALRNSHPRDDMEYAYETLRAYLMLHDAERYDADFMHTWLLGDMVKLLPEGYTRTQFDELDRHVASLTRSRILASPFPMDEELVSQRREELAAFTLSQRAYSRIQRLLRDAPAESHSVVSMGGPQATSVFYRASGKPLTHGIPGLFSYQGYWKVFNTRIGAIVGELLRDDVWILGTAEAQRLDLGQRAQLERNVRQLYLNDYVRLWDEYLSDIKVRKGESMLQNIQIARVLSAPDSPLVRMVQAVARETHLLRESNEDARALVERAQGRVSSTRNTLEQMFGSVRPDGLPRDDASDERMERIVDEHFQPFRQLLSAEGGGVSAMQATTGLLDEFYTYLTATDAALRSANAPPSDGVVTKLQAEATRLPNPLREVLTDMSDTAMGEISAQVQEGLGENVEATIGLFCRQAIAGRYPFSRASQRDVAPNDMARMFAPGGMMGQFFQQHLVGRVDMSQKRWRFKSGVQGQESRPSGFLDAFQRASVIGHVYFTGAGAEPSFSVTIRPVRMSPEITQFTLDVDGQVVRYAHGPIVGTQVRWPGTQGSGRVRMEVLPAGRGASSAIAGPWALHRWMDGAKVTQGRTPDSMLATFQFDGREVVLEVVANSVKNPLRLAEMEGFSCPGAQ